MADPKYGLRRYVLCDVVFEVVAFAPAIVFLMRSLDRTPKRSQLKLQYVNAQLNGKQVTC